MPDAPYVLRSVEPRLLQHAGTSGSTAPAAGWLVGLPNEDGVLISSILRSDANFDKTAELQADLKQASSLLPAGLRIVGAYVLLKDKMTIQRQSVDLAICSFVALHTHQQRTSLAQSQLFCAVLTADSVSWFQLLSATSVKPITTKSVAQSQGDASSQDALTQSNTDWLHGHFSSLYCEMPVQLHIYGARPVSSADAQTDTSKGQTLAKAVAKAVDAAIADLCGPSIVVVAKTSSSEPRLLTHPNSQDTSKSSPEGQCIGDLKGSSGEALDLTILTSGSGSAGPPCIHYQPVARGPCSYDRVTVHLSTLCIIPDATPLSDLQAQFLQPAIKSQLADVQQKITADGKLRPWTAFQVQPPGWPHPLTLLYPLTKSSTKPPSKGQPAAPQAPPEGEQELRSMRQALHDRLGLPSNRPLLRLNNAVDPRRTQGGPQSLPGGSSARLQDVHVGISAPQVPGGAVHMIEGSYDYHHYMQDKTDDAGWGCAYRSLQTIHSWFRHQHYTQTPVPALREIQQTLVDIGDKPQAFVGSREWIGAIELGYVLDERLGVAAKVITVSSGADMGSKAREIAQHFDSQGTPIMIGGGVLAYTLLGISYNEKTGECAFLILDPHYTGGEDLSKVQNGQWVAWKNPLGKAAAGGPLFVQSAFYNLLCPQRPDMI